SKTITTTHATSSAAFVLDIFRQQTGLSNLYLQLTIILSLSHRSFPDVHKTQITDLLSNGLERVSTSFPWVAGQVINTGADPSPSTLNGDAEEACSPGTHPVILLLPSHSADPPPPPPPPLPPPPNCTLDYLLFSAVVLAAHKNFGTSTHSPTSSTTFVSTNNVLTAFILASGSASRAPVLRVARLPFTLPLPLVHRLPLPLLLQTNRTETSKSPMALEITSRELGRKIDLMLVFEPPTTGNIYVDTFPVCWKVLSFSDTGTASATIEYTGNTELFVSQMESGHHVSAYLFQRCMIVEQCTLKNHDHIMYLTHAVDGTSGIIQCINETDR
ncbi:hypothetical protein CVT25_007559, partial [Psilocybe cyanescens]